MLTFDLCLPIYKGIAKKSSSSSGGEAAKMHTSKNGITWLEDFFFPGFLSLCKDKRNHYFFILVLHFKWQWGINEFAEAESMPG